MACVALNRRKYENVKPVFLHGKVVTRGRPFLNIRIHLTFIGWVVRFSTTAYNQVFSYTVINWYNTLCSCTTSILKERIASNNANSVLDSQRFWVSGGGGEARYKKYSCKGKSYETTETTCKIIVSRYQTLVSSLPWMYVFLQRRPKTEIITELATQANIFLRWMLFKGALPLKMPYDIWSCGGHLDYLKDMQFGQWLMHHVIFFQVPWAENRCLSSNVIAFGLR